MRLLVFAGCCVIAFSQVTAHAAAWQPSPGHAQMPIWPGAVPDAKRLAGPETATIETDLVAGRPWLMVGHVSRPTMTVYSPRGKNTGAAVIVFPGGGYEVLAIDLEGTEVCDWLTSRGITCVLLKYRVPGEGLTPESGAYPKSPMALEDAQRTMGLVRLPQEFRFPGDRVRVRRAEQGVLLEPVISDLKQWFAELDRFYAEPFMPKGRKQPRTPRREIFQ